MTNLPERVNLIVTSGKSFEDLHLLQIGLVDFLDGCMIDASPRFPFNESWELKKRLNVLSEKMNDYRIELANWGMI